MRCPACAHEVLAEPDPRESVALKRCPSCGLAETAGFKSAPEDAQRLYGEDFYSKPAKRSAAARLFAPVERFFMRRRALALARELPRGARRVLDVGCGAGTFLQALGVLVPGLELGGVETSATGAAIARQRGVDAFCGTLAELPRAASYDALSLWHVLEHVEDPLELLQEARSRLGEGGVLLVAVPNVDSLGFRLFGAAWGFLDLPRHRWHFTPAALAALLRRAGFDARWDARSLFEYETPLGVLSLLNAVSGADQMLFYNAVKNERPVSGLKRLKLFALFALTPLAGIVALVLDAAGRLAGRPNNVLMLARKTAQAQSN